MLTLNKGSDNTLLYALKTRKYILNFLAYICRNVMHQIEYFASDWTPF